MKQYLLGLAGAGALLLAVASCNNEDLVNSQPLSSSALNEIKVNIQGIENDTRTDFTIGETGAKFTWVENDVIGVYPIEGGQQANFVYQSGDNFAVGNWKLAASESNSYAAYYPFVEDENINLKAVPFDFNGQKQKGDATTAHIGAYDFLAAAATQVDAEGNLTLNFKHLGCLVRMQLKMLEAGTVNSVILSADDAVFASRGTIDLTSEAPAVSSTENAYSFTLGLDGGLEVTAGQTITLYMMIPPVDLTENTLKVTAKYASGTNYTGTVANCNIEFKANKAYKVDGELNDKETVVVEKTWSGSVCYNTGDWTAEELTADEAVGAMLVKYSDGSYAIKNAYDGVEMRFTVNENGQLTITNAYDNQGSKYYYDANSASYYVYDADYSYASISGESANIWWMDYGSDYRYNCFTYTKGEYVGMFYYQEDTTAEQEYLWKKVATAVDNGDGTYTIKDAYAAGYDFSFSINSDASITVTNSYKKSGGYSYVAIGTGDSDIVACYTAAYGGYAYSDGAVTSDYLSVWWSRYDYSNEQLYGADYFYWGIDLEVDEAEEGEGGEETAAR